MRARRAFAFDPVALGIDLMTRKRKKSILNNILDDEKSINFVSLFSNHIFSLIINDKSMKHYQFILVLVMLFALGAISTACGDDNDEPNNDSHLSSEAAAFVGYWVAEENNGSSWNHLFSDLILYDDGTCATSIYKSEDGLSYHSNFSFSGLLYDDGDWNSPNSGTWSYSSQTKLLSNSANHRTYEVMRIDDQSMLCVDIQTKETIEYIKKNNELRAAQLALAGTWVSAQGDSILISLSDWNDQYYYKNIYLSASFLESFKSILPSRNEAGGLVNWGINNNLENRLGIGITDNSYKYDYVLSTAWASQSGPAMFGTFLGKIIIENIFSPHRQKFSFTEPYPYYASCMKLERTFYKKLRYNN